MNYAKENDAKADFNSIYTEPTPHKYITSMADHGYRINGDGNRHLYTISDISLFPTD